jgi:hypothetical protein
VQKIEASIMNKGVIQGIIWTLVLAIPFTGLAIGILAFMNDVLPEIVRSIEFPSVDWRGLAVEGSARSPEVAGMIIGQLVILALLPIARRMSRVRQDN